MNPKHATYSFTHHFCDEPLVRVDQNLSLHLTQPAKINNMSANDT